MCYILVREKRRILKLNPAFGEREDRIFSVYIWPKSFADKRSSRSSQNSVFKCFENQARRQLNWIGGGGTDVEVELRPRSVYTSVIYWEGGKAPLPPSVCKLENRF